MSTTDHTPRLIVLLGALAALASCNVSTPAHSADRAPIVHGPNETFIHIGSAPAPKATTARTVKPSETFIRIVSPKASATPSPVTPAPMCKAPTTSGLSPLTFDSPVLPPSTYLHPAYPEVRPYAAPSASYGHGTTRTTGTVSTPHGVLRFDSTSKH